MDFDEYDYLEKTVENPEPVKVKETVNGGERTNKSLEKERSRSSKHRNDENDEESLHHSKRPKFGDDSRDRKERHSSRHRSLSRDIERSERDRHRSSRELRGKDRGGDREERNGKDRNPEMERDRYREKDRDRERRERDHEKVRERDLERSHRSRSHSERHKEVKEMEKFGDRARSQDREHKEREREMERERERELRERDRENRRRKEKKEEVTEPEVDPERDQRTVFAYQICLKADERDVYEFFSRAGKVRDVRLIMDRNSRRSKGVGYIEFYDVMSVPMAIALSGQLLLGNPVMVKPSEAEKNLVQSTTAATGAGGLTGPYSGGARRLYVGNLHVNITEDQLRQVFEPFGTVELVQLPLDESGHCRGFGFVQFARLEDARASQSLNGQLEIAGRIIKVSAVTDQVGMQDGGANTGDLDDDEGGGLSLNARSRALLMQKLDRSGNAPSMAGSFGPTPVSNPALTLPTAPVLGAPPAAPPLVAPHVHGSLPGLPGTAFQMPSVTAPSVDTIGVPSECLLLKNMFDPNAETEPDFDLDIKEDVEDECSKYGKVKHIFVDKDSSGFVYLRFEIMQAAVSAQRALHGRWFAGKMITATFMLPENYEAKFPNCR